MADNYRFDVMGGDLAQSLALAFTGARTVKGWRVQERENEPPRLILYWFIEGEKNVTPTPAPLDLSTTVAFVQQWLDATPWDPKHPWGEIWTAKGCRVYCEDWGHVAGDHGAFVAIEPYQLWIGK